MKTRRRICRIKRIQVQKVKWPDVELNECRIKRERSVVRSYVLISKLGSKTRKTKKRFETSHHLKVEGTKDTYYQNHMNELNVSLT